MNILHKHNMPLPDEIPAARGKSPTRPRSKSPKKPPTTIASAPTAAPTPRKGRSRSKSPAPPKRSATTTAPATTPTKDEVRKNQVRSVSPAPTTGGRRMKSSGMEDITKKNTIRSKVRSLSPLRLKKSKDKDKASSSPDKQPYYYKEGEAPAVAPIYALKEEMERKVAHSDDAKFEKAVRRCIPSHFTLIATVDDTSEAQEALHASKLFDLPNAKGREGGVGTSALLMYLYDHIKVVTGQIDSENKPFSCRKVLRGMHKLMKTASTPEQPFDNVPQLSCSRPLGPPRTKNFAPFFVVPPTFDPEKNTKRALLIGVNFQNDEDKKLHLRAPHNDVHNCKEFLLQCGFSEGKIMILKDDGKCMNPTRANIEKCFQMMITLSKPGDVLFIQYSGHGGLITDLSGDEESGFDSYIMPSDHASAGVIIDDYILSDLIKAIPNDVHTTMLCDCCHSGT